jgi:cytochrome c oxidase subunit III
MSSIADHLDVSHLEEQFRNPDQQREAATLGMWTFLATEVLFFGGLLVAYAVYRIRWPEDFRHGSLDLKWYLGGINTAVLLLSSFSMVLAVRASQKGDNHRIIRYLLITMALAITFVGIKFCEYYVEYDEGLLPGKTFRAEEPAPSRESALTRHLGQFEAWMSPVARDPGENSRRTEHEELFMCFYFILTAIHATHMLIGIGVMTVLAIMARNRKFSQGWHNPVEITGLYWHFVDTVWVFLFPILYLLRNP